ncbi:acetyl-CoA carboxylase biotin carboxylase subunit [Culicoidibacter larvae]|uniref:Biotin carboxylase n=1 Tax=Culicoidibacter larvae TaxID=2579976 RepID=A0A5R8QII9_9FIRM|nr:acetyl-CoA carboxylase biotin carboxylase subunit [Culicoidibacter larvae]TLG77067.1 acetyl-CoA carboxylase biotin carboxylase subunit [Culicoidibacter larvae]
MFTKILIANRGEIAVRIIRACNEMGIETVAIYAKGDEDALHVQLADQAICVGPAKATESYLNMTAILSAAISTGAQAIHPGFGFLSENAEFVGRCEECGIVFIGPKSETIEKMGDKAQARDTAMRAKVPVVPGSDGILTDLKEAKELAKRIQYPVLIKAVSGGGGKGMRIVEREIDLEAMIKAAQMEAQAAFGDETVYMEKFIVEPKHIEFQILADHHGHVVHLGERDCSVQRRNQKMIEEAPSVFLDDKLRARMGNDAVKLAKNVKYRNAGTIEFLVDKENNYYFIEMNTRIQVEHPVTEMITGIDLVKEQIRIAAGMELPFTQKNIQIRGHAIECRINAEDPEHDFRPSPGKISTLVLPGGNGIRIDSAVYQGYTVPPTYDSMIAKLIVYGQDREEALAKMRRALEEFIIFDIKNNIDFQYSIINHPSFILGNFDTSFIAKQMLAKTDRKEK